MKTVTIFLKNGSQVKFQTNSFTVGIKVDADDQPIMPPAVDWITWMKKEKGVSLEFIDYNEVVAITSDTSGS